eukprot:623457-Rhodomonas_salina.1
MKPSAVDSSKPAPESPSKGLFLLARERDARFLIAHGGNRGWRDFEEPPPLSRSAALSCCARIVRRTLT